MSKQLITVSGNTVAIDTSGCWSCQYERHEDYDHQCTLFNKPLELSCGVGNYHIERLQECVDAEKNT